MNIPPLRIGTWEYSVPLVQGGMGVGISGPKLVGAVLAEGALGTLTPFGLGDMSKRLTEDEFIRTSGEAFQLEVEKLRSITDKPFAVNFMKALTNINKLIETALKLKVKIIVMGAGIPSNLPALVEDPGVALVPIISSARLADLILRSWKKYGRSPDAIIIEGPKAGGHLGFTKEQLTHIDDFSLEKILQETLTVIQPVEQKIGRKIPIIVAGGIYTGDDIAKMFSLGASGAQMGTRFVATFECEAEALKKAYLDAREEDIQIIDSPVGMPGRAINNIFLQRLHYGDIPKPACPFHCIISCEKEKAGFCIAERLRNTLMGNLDEGLIFCGANAYRIDRIISVHDLIEELMAGVRASPLELPYRT
jgi:nitronate monooxygenase